MLRRRQLTEHRKAQIHTYLAMQMARSILSRNSVAMRAIQNFVSQRRFNGQKEKKHRPEKEISGESLDNID